VGKHGQYGALVALLLAGPAGAECRLALALGFDVSRSVDYGDYRIQRDGILAALTDPGIREAILKPKDDVALAIFEWSGVDHQKLILDWTLVQSQADLDGVVVAFAAAVRDDVPRATGLGTALVYAGGLMDAAPDCAARVLDMSGDGRNNVGIGPDDAYAERDFGDVMVNGLAIAGHESDIADYYAAHVIRGRGAFVEAVAKHEDFPKAFRRKLERELTERIMGDAAPGAPAE
jgi:Protein of unknown function (DUF1194)